MARGGNNRMPAEVKRRYFERIRSGLSGSDASQRVGVSLSCGSVWFTDAGRVAFEGHLRESSRAKGEWTDGLLYAVLACERR